VTPAAAPGGRGPSPSTTVNVSGDHWFNIFGPVLSVHDRHRYTSLDRFMPTGKVIPTGTVLAGRTSIGVYFCADWCGPCTTFTPILKQYYEERRACKGTSRADSFEVILVSRCRTAATTEHLVLTMPWPSIPHIDSVGPRGDSLMSLYGITTLPASVLLDGTGMVVCQDGRAKVVNRQAGRGSTPTNPWQPVPDCDLPAAARQRPTGVHLPPDP